MVIEVGTGQVNSEREAVNGRGTSEMHQGFISSHFTPLSPRCDDHRGQKTRRAPLKIPRALIRKRARGVDARSGTPPLFVFRTGSKLAEATAPADRRKRCGLVRVEARCRQRGAALWHLCTARGGWLGDPSKKKGIRRPLFTGTGAWRASRRWSRITGQGRVVAVARGTHESARPSLSPEVIPLEARLI